MLMGGLYGCQKVCEDIYPESFDPFPSEQIVSEGVKMLSNKFSFTDNCFALFSKLVKGVE